MEKRGKAAPTFEDHSQNFWQLACIQSASLGLSGFLCGAQLAKIYGIGTTITSIIVGNFILWAIGIGIVCMSDKHRLNAIQNVKDYIGKKGSILYSLILITTFLIWYVIQIDSTASTISDMIEAAQITQSNIKIRIGATLGIFTALLSIGGIRLIKKLCVFTLPILFLFVILINLKNNFTIPNTIIFGISFPCIAFTVSQTIAGFVNLSTFFRHSRSRIDSIIALFIITIITNIFSLSTIFLEVSDPSNFSETINPKNFLTAYNMNILLVSILSLLCTNLVNIYLASAGWETIFPHITDRKEYAIIGLLGTAAYTFLQIPPPMLFIENTLETFISCIGLVLLVGFFVKILIKHRPRPMDKFLSFLCWIFGCFVATKTQIESPENSIIGLVSGICTSLVCYLIILFIEETTWSIKKLIRSKSN